MPELPEVEAVTTKLRSAVLGAPIVAVEILRASSASPKVLEAAGATICDISRRAKNILIELDTGAVLRVHLRMTGNLLVIPDYRFRPLSARLLFRLGDNRAIILEDPRALGRAELLDREELAALSESYGPEPLSAEFTRERFAAELSRSRLPIKQFLMDQARLAGLGNIWAAEALFEARVHPQVPANALSAQAVSRLHVAIVAVLTRAVQSALALYTTPSHFSEAELLGLSVYGREGESCRRCGSPICRIPQAGRSTYFCSRCQRLPVPDSTRSGNRSHRNQRR